MAERARTVLMFVGDQRGRAEEAVELWVSLLDDSRVLDVEHGEAGVKRVHFTLAGREYVAMDAPGEHAFTFTPAISLFVDFDSEARLDAAFERLSDGATFLMPLGEYPFSPKFCWLQDRYGVSWQLNLAPA